MAARKFVTKMLHAALIHVGLSVTIRSLITVAGVPVVTDVLLYI